jgi:hypothetical protein
MTMQMVTVGPRINGNMKQLKKNWCQIVLFSEKDDLTPIVGGQK